MLKTKPECSYNKVKSKKLTLFIILARKSEVIMDLLIDNR